jgi:signal transduction histidine kinase
MGVSLALAAAGIHAREALVLDELTGPLMAFLFDGIPAIGLAYLGHWIATTDLSTRGQWTVLVWCFAGGAAFVSVFVVTFLIRTFEGRTVAEPVFPALVAAAAGGLAGLTAGYFNARARRDARRARTVGDALSFVNHLVRHDLRNDLNVIRSHASLLVRSSGDGDPEVVADKADEALAHIGTTRTIAETLVGDADLEPVDLVAVVTDIAATVEETFGVPVTVEAPDRALVTANDGIRSVVDNLLENAVEHGSGDDRPAAADLHVAVTVECGRTDVRLRISDDGPGIDPDRRETLFGADDDADGLSLVAALVDAYGGDVRVDDDGSPGATVVVELPRADADADAGADTDTDTGTRPDPEARTS